MNLTTVEQIGQQEDDHTKDRGIYEGDRENTLLRWKLVIDNLNDLVAIINASTLSFQPSLQHAQPDEKNARQKNTLWILYIRIIDSKSINQSKMHS